MARNLFNEELFDMIVCYIKNEKNGNRSIDFDKYTEKRQTPKLVRNLHLKKCQECIEENGRCFQNKCVVIYFTIIHLFKG